MAAAIVWQRHHNMSKRRMGLGKDMSSGNRDPTGGKPKKSHAGIFERIIQSAYQHRHGVLFLPRAETGRGRDIAVGQQVGIRHDLLSWGAHKPEAVVRVAVARRVVVPVGRPAVPRVVVPAPAAKDPVRACAAIPHGIEKSNRHADNDTWNRFGFQAAKS